MGKRRKVMSVGVASVATSGVAWGEVIDPEGSGAWAEAAQSRRGRNSAPLWTGEQEGPGHTVTAINVPLNVPNRRRKALESGKASFLLTWLSTPFHVH